MANRRRIVTCYSEKQDGLVFSCRAATDEEAVAKLVAALNRDEEWCELRKEENEGGDVQQAIVAIGGSHNTRWYLWVEVGVVDEHGFCQGAVQW